MSLTTIGRGYHSFVSHSIPDGISTATVIPLPQSVDPTVIALQATVTSQQLEIETLQRDLSFEIRYIHALLTIGVIAAGILGLTGWQAFRGVGETIRKRIRTLTSKYYYQLDVTNLKFHIQDGHQQDGLIELLKSQGIYKIRRFQELDTYSLGGITVYAINNKEDEVAYVEFIERYYNQLKRLSPKKAGFLLYAPAKGVRIDNETIEKYPNTAVANTPWSLISIALVLGRHITAPPTFDEDDKEE